jgi:fatty-acyl-CoA synthase
MSGELNSTTKAEEGEFARQRAAQLSLAEILRRNAVRTPRAPALRFGARTVSYGELDERSDRLAAALHERGIAARDAVPLWLHNGIEIVETLFALHKLGAAAAPLNFRLSADEAAFILGDIGARGIIADARLLEAAGDALDADWTLVVGDTPDCSYEEAIGRQQAPPPTVVVDDDDAAFVMYTSGTTGRPKGAVLTHKNLIANTWSWTFEVGIRRSDIYTPGLPLFHIGGLVGLYPFLQMGSLVVLQPTGGFDPDEAFDTIVRNEATVCAFVPAQWQVLVEREQAGEKLSRVRRAVWGGSPASRPLLEQMTAILPENSVVSTFGQTEVTANATFLHAADALRKLGSVGHAALTVEHRIVDDSDSDVATGEIGEIVYRGPTVMREYFRRPEATEQAFLGGWFHGGDLVREDDEGFIYVIDRKDDMIISGAENIYPAEIERTLVEHPGVAETAVVGAPDPTWGETPVAFVVASDSQAVDSAELVALCTERLARFKRPSRIVFIDALPRNAGGKVLKRDLRAQATGTGEAA